LWYDLDGNENDFALNISLLQQSTDTRQRESLMLAPPLLRLVQSILSSSKHGIEDISMVLGCPILMYDETSLQLSQKSTIVREFVCSTLYHAVNWFRQILNTFVSYESPETRIKILQRAHQLIELENKMNIVFNMTPHFRPPVPELLRSSLKSRNNGGNNKKKRKVVTLSKKGGKGKGKGQKKGSSEPSKKRKKVVRKKKKITAKAQMKKIAATAKEKGSNSDSSDDSSDDDDDDEKSSGTDSEDEEEEEEEDASPKKKSKKESSSSSSSSSVPSERMLDRLSKEANAGKYLSEESVHRVMEAL
jgi:hypothetical protein